MNTKRPHMVSKGYIKGWADAKGIVEVIDIQGRRGLRQPIGNATVVNYVYEPTVLTTDLEAAYGQIESAGTPVIVKLRDRDIALTSADIAAMIAFMEMHLDRGRYADQAKVRTPAVLVKTGWHFEDAELSLGDRLLLSQSLPDVLRLATLGLEQWTWTVISTEGLPTGDGAVLLWVPTKGADICTVSFPLSPTRLLVIGEELPDGIPIHTRITDNCKRWIIGAPGTLNLAWADDGRAAST
ncbi:DUF4238 domain-containing protein [Cryobacterium sp. W22_MBD10_FK3]|uniref:DUF4238 domain-containing protein n=1 Tax=Cryobacterium sp. W22_MBD10_FK3 TaxID=3240273 RepID=UPI003F921EC4